MILSVWNYDACQKCSITIIIIIIIIIIGSSSNSSSSGGVIGLSS